MWWTLVAAVFVAADVGGGAAAVRLFNYFLCNLLRLCEEPTPLFTHRNGPELHCFVLCTSFCFPHTLFAVFLFFVCLPFPSLW